MSGDILNQIDGALDDWISADAMRWSPEPDAVPQPTRAALAVLRMPDPDPESIRRFVAQLEAMRPAIERAFADIGEAFRKVGDTVAGWQHAMSRGDYHRRHRVNRRDCPRCCPHARVAPLPIDGHALRRRQRTRARRKR